MLNYDGITKTSVTNANQILANVSLQYSVGCIVKQNIGVTVGSRKIAKAGTPIKIDMKNLQTPAEKADGSTNAMNAVLLHDVDVTDGNKNGTALIFGFVNYNRLEEDVQGVVDTAVGNTTASKDIVFLAL